MIGINIFTGEKVDIDIFKLDRKADKMYKYTFYFDGEKVRSYIWNTKLTTKQALTEFKNRMNMSSVYKGLTVKISDYKA